MSDQFLKMPFSVLFADVKNLTWLEKCIVAYRLSYGDDYFASNEYVAEKFKTTKKTVCVAFQRAREIGILPQEQMFMKDIINQSGSYGNVTGSYGNVTNDYGNVTGSYGNVTDELLYRNQNEADLPMKTDVLLDQCIRSVILKQSITSVILPETESCIKSSQPRLDIIIQGSNMKLKSYHRMLECYKDKLKPECLYVFSKGWWLGLSKDDYDKAAKSLKQNN